jgi:hypothetical protein
VTTALGEQPEHLSDISLVIWCEAAAQGAAWLTGADRFLFEIAAALMVSFRAGTASTSQTRILVTVLNKLGFGPSERSKINAPQAKEPAASPFQAFN